MSLWKVNGVDEVSLKCVVFYGNMPDGIQECMRQYGYGYDHVAHVGDDDGGYAFLATEHLTLTEVEVDMINDYFRGKKGSSQYLLDAKGKRIKIED